MRLFIAIPVSSEVRGELASLVQRWQRADDDLRWMPPEMWHVTLQFLGSASAQQYACVADSLRTVSSPPFAVQLGGLGFFERAGIFHVSVERSAELLTLQQRIVTATSKCGFVAEDRPYSPHITLARKRGRGAGIQRLKARVGAGPKFHPFTTREFLLFESFPGSSGSRYEVRVRFALGS
ncbi:MAG: RNA 2',3'-cyclic phosphodiesterase [Acidobacteriota bacterium]